MFTLLIGMVELVIEVWLAPAEVSNEDCLARNNSSNAVPHLLRKTTKPRAAKIVLIFGEAPNGCSQHV